MRYQLAFDDPIDAVGQGGKLPPFAFEQLVGRSPSLVEAVERARALGVDGSRTILLLGAPGTGKELFARAIHYSGRASDEPFMTLDCRGVPERHLELELFGHEPGAISNLLRGKRGLLEMAGSGTLFLGRIEHLPHGLQPRLLETLQEREAFRVGGREPFPVTCRVITSATSQLLDAVEQGRFRRDLFDMIEDSIVEVPPLRDRQGDIELLARHFISEISRSEGLAPRALTSDAVAALQSHEWPGNVRELAIVLRRALLGTDKDPITADDLSVGRPAQGSGQRTEEEGATIFIPAEGRTLEAIEAEAVAAIVRMAGGNRSKAARILGISRPTLRRKLALAGDSENGTGDDRG